jgi:hypothetical protein
VATCLHALARPSQQQVGVGTATVAVFCNAGVQHSQAVSSPALLATKPMEPLYDAAAATTRDAGMSASAREDGCI